MSLIINDLARPLNRKGGPKSLKNRVIPLMYCILDMQSNQKTGINAAILQLGADFKSDFYVTY